MTFSTDNGSIYHEGRWYVDAQLNASGARGDQGLEFPNSGIYFDSPSVTAADVRTISKSSPIVASSLEKYRKFCFTGARLVVVPPVNDESVTEDAIQDLQQKVDQADRLVRTVLRINQAWMDKKVYGSAIFEYKMGKTAEFAKGPVLFKRLPAHSFDTTPSDRDVNEDRYIPGDILLGIVYDNQDNIYEYWQRQGNYTDPIQIDSRNVLHVRDEIADSPDGRSLVATITSLVKRLQYTEQALMQYVHRVGAPGLWAEIQDYSDKDAAMVASNPDVWSFDEAFKQGKKIIKNWGKDTVIVTPSRIQLKPLNFTVPLDPMAIIDHFERRILYTIIARDFTEQMGQAISQSGAPGLSMLVLMARNEQDEIAEPFCEWWEKILEANGYEGWSVSIEWRDLTEDTEDQMYMRSEIAAKVGAWTIDEIREIAGWEPLTKTQKDELGISEEAKAEEAKRAAEAAQAATQTPEEAENQPPNAVQEDSDVSDVISAYKKAIDKFTKSDESDYRYTSMSKVASVGSKSIFRVNDGWGEWYILRTPSKTEKIAQKMPDVGAFYAESPISKILTKQKVKEIGWSDAKWDKFMSDWLESEGVQLNTTKEEIELADLLAMKGSEFTKFLEDSGVSFPIEE